MNLLQFWSAGYQIDDLGMDIPSACKGSARRNAASNGKRNFHKTKNESKRFKKSIGRYLSVRKQKQKKGIPTAHPRGNSIRPDLWTPDEFAAALYLGWDKRPKTEFNARPKTARK
jgi:hypothetical protein